MENKPTRPTIRILPDETYDGHRAMFWCGWFPGGYSSIGTVRDMTLLSAVEFYCRVLQADRSLGVQTWNW